MMAVLTPQHELHLAQVRRLLQPMQNRLKDPQGEQQDESEQGYHDRPSNRLPERRDEPHDRRGQRNQRGLIQDDSGRSANQILQVVAAVPRMACPVAYAVSLGNSATTPKSMSTRYDNVCSPTSQSP